MNPGDFRTRTKAFALECIRLVEALPKTRVAFRLGDQLLRSGTSVGANYRAACRAKSPADFMSKMGTVEEEADESIYWIELLIAAKNVHAERVAWLVSEANEILAMTVASINTTRARGKAPIRSPQSGIRNR
jgi:four helix bundle protein